jgi:hypothetical protein
MRDGRARRPPAVRYSQTYAQRCSHEEQLDESAAAPLARANDVIEGSARKCACWTIAESVLRVQVLGGVEGFKSALKIALEIFDILQPDVEPQRRSARRPFGGRAVARAVKRNDEALEAAP